MVGECLEHNIAWGCFWVVFVELRHLFEGLLIGSCRILAEVDSVEVMISSSSTERSIKPTSGGGYEFIPWDVSLVGKGWLQSQKRFKEFTAVLLRSNVNPVGLNLSLLTHD